MVSCAKVEKNVVQESKERCTNNARPQRPPAMVRKHRIAASRSQGEIGNCSVGCANKARRDRLTAVAAASWSKGGIFLVVLLFVSPSFYSPSPFQDGPGDVMGL